MLRLEGIVKTYGKNPVLSGINLELKENEFFALLGPSGCGKSTLLKIIAGITQPDRGAVFMDNREVTQTSPQQRNCSLVFQHYALLPHLNVFDNVCFPLAARAYGRKAGWLGKIFSLLGPLSRHLTQEDVHEVYAALKLVRLEAMAGRRSATLSGGEAQRVALARALVTKPDLLLMDEPLASLDRQLKLELRDELKRIHEQIGITFFYVTHDQEEAVSLAGRLGLMNGGSLVQIGSPREILDKPQNEWVSGFFNKKNIVNPQLVALLAGR